MKNLMLYSVAGVAAVSIISAAVLKLYAPLGSSPDKCQRDRFNGLRNYRKGKFANADAKETNLHLSDGLSMLKDSLFAGDVERNPVGELPVAELDCALIESRQDSLTWFGHSTFLLSIDGRKLFIDPMLGNRASPLSFFGSARYSKDWLEAIDRLPQVDAVLLTHDHYDHLDYGSIRALKSKVEHFFVPLGVGAHLSRWGIDTARITELGWWEEVSFNGLTLALTPSKHFSGRGLFNRNSTLWGGWAVIGEQIRFYTSGDGGYGSHFKEIGDAYGPFDLALIEGGQYDPRWETSHMKPEQSVQAHVDVGGDKMMLVHWAAFTLAFHSWTDPIERASKAAAWQGVELVTPQVGETLSLQALDSYTPVRWWTR